MLGREGQEDGQTYSKAVNDAFAALEGGNATDEAFLRSWVISIPYLSRLLCKILSTKCKINII